MERKYLPLVCDLPFVLALASNGEDDTARISFIWVNPHSGQTLLFGLGSST
jgi:hypothetical protein